MKREKVERSAFNKKPSLPYDLRLEDFEIAMRDVYDYLYDANKFFLRRGLERFEDMTRPATLSGILSDMLSASIAKHSRALTQNRHHNGHPDLIRKHAYPNDSIKAGKHGVEIKCTRKKGGQVDTHGAREQWLCVVVYAVDKSDVSPARRQALKFTEVYVGRVKKSDFRKNERGELGTRTATVHGLAMKRFRSNWVYKLDQ